ncbi:MAG TPA: HDOD domain-containing protein [Candidatus Sulfotelmatobacter sp.]|nr:HDOD domain-containing protein [Candidatus Sulfotelmatobacter sp.]
MNAAVDEALRARVKNLEAMPAMPAILAPLLRCLELPPDQIEVEKVTELISCDKSIAAQCLRMANSALFSRRGAIETIRGAVVALGARRLRDILWSSFLIQMAPKAQWPINPMTFWEHSFGVALVSQQLAKKVALPEVEKVYLCGLLHDIGELVNATLLPEEFHNAVEYAVKHSISLYEAEKEILGFTHCDSGKLLGDYWNLSSDIQNVIEFHHTPAEAPPPPALAAAVNLADLLCRLRGMGYGYDELREIEFSEAPAWLLLAKAVPHLEKFDVARFTMELDAEAEEIHELVAAAFQT